MDTRILINCMDRDVNVLVDGEIVPLPRGIIPALIASPGEAEAVTIEVMNVEEKSVRETQVIFYGSLEPVGVMALPPFLPGVWNLVEPEAITQFPWRDDFVTPSMWEYIGQDIYPMDFDSDEEDEGSEITETFFNQMVLSGVTRTVNVSATSDTPVLEW